MPGLDFLVPVLLVFLLAGFVKGVVGMGLPTVSIALLAASIGLKEGIALIVVPTIVTNVWQALVGGRLAAIVTRLWPMLLAACAGTWVGAGLLARADAVLLAAVLGMLLCLYAGHGLTRPQLPPPGEHERWMSPLAGGLAGLSTGLTGTFAVPGTMYLQALGLKRDVLVQALGVAFVLTAAVLGAGLAAHGLMPQEIGLMSAAAVAPALLGMVLGQRLRWRLSEDMFRRLFLLALLGLGAWLALRPLIFY